MTGTICPVELSTSITDVISNLVGIKELYPSQFQILEAIFAHDNIFYTGSTNSGKTLPTIIYPEVLKKLNEYGHKFPASPKVLFVTALNSLQLSLLNNTKSIGLSGEILTCQNASELLKTDISVLFVSAETLKLPNVTRLLLENRHSFVLKVVDEAHLGRATYS